MHPRPYGLLGLPTEIFLYIVESQIIECQDLLNCMLVCKHLRDVLEDSMLWTYQRELERDGLIDGVSTLTTAAKLETLLDRRRRWRDFDPISVETLCIPFDEGPCSLVGGVFARVVRGPDPGTYGIAVALLPNTCGNDHIRDILPDSYSWKSVQALAIDPAQDLLAFLDWDPLTRKCHLNIKTLFAQEPHPSAAQSRIALSSGRGHLTDRESDMKLGSDLIAVHKHNKTRVWNWKTGVIIWEGISSKTQFFFLSPSLYIVVRNKNSPSVPTVDLYRVNRVPERASCIAHLLLPQLEKETSGNGLSLACMDIVIQTTPLGDPATGNPFISSPRDGLLLLGYCCEVQLTERYLPLTDIVYAVILRTSGIFRLASGIALSEVNSMQEKVPVYKWHEWAQNEVAVLQSDNDEFSDGAYSVERVHGSRIVFGDFEWYTNDSDRHLATIYRQSDDAEETPIGPPAPISLGAHDFKLELDSKPAVRRLKIGMKVISAFTPSGEFYLDQNHILALEPNSHEPENCALGHEHESDSNRRKVKVWTMG